MVNTCELPINIVRINKPKLLAVSGLDQKVRGAVNSLVYGATLITIPIGGQAGPNSFAYWGCKPKPAEFVQQGIASENGQNRNRRARPGGGPGQEGYSDFVIPPVGQIYRHLIASEKANMDHIAATLGLKEMSQSVLVRKICTLSGHHRTRKAILEFDKPIRSIYTLRYLRDPQLQRDVHCSEKSHRVLPPVARHRRTGER